MRPRHPRRRSGLRSFRRGGLTGSCLFGDAVDKMAPSLLGAFCISVARESCRIREHRPAELPLCAHRENARAQLIEATARPIALRRSRNGFRLSPSQNFEILTDLEAQDLAIPDDLAAVHENVLDGPVVGRVDKAADRL